MTATRDAGDSASWFRATDLTISTGSPADVPCGDCTACCRSSQFIHIDADETTTLRRIPRQFLTTAPGGAPGTMVMGFDQAGVCPMLRDDHCSIYEDHPRTCRAYDCRVYAATGVGLLDPSQHLVADTVARWDWSNRFDSNEDPHLAATQRAAEFLTTTDELQSIISALHPMQVAYIAIALRSLFAETAPPPTSAVLTAIEDFRSRMRTRNRT